MNTQLRRIFGALLLLAGCAADEAGFGASDERFIETMVELRRAAGAAGWDTTQFEQLRRSVLEAQGVTEQELRAYVTAHAGELDHMAAVWDSISARLAQPPVEQ